MSMRAMRRLLRPLHAAAADALSASALEASAESSRELLERLAFLHVAADVAPPPEILLGDELPFADRDRSRLRERIRDLRASFPTDDAVFLATLHEQLLSLTLEMDDRGKHVANADARARKQSGVFYTPPSVVRYIVRKAIDGRPRTVVDPACGCGLFLVEGGRRIACLNKRSADPLSVLPSLHGVDIDHEAALVARRVLWLETLRGWGVSKSRRFQRLDAERAAAIACENIRVSDALADESLDRFAGRADVVLGNPPYRKERHHGDAMRRLAETALGRRYGRARIDLSHYFLHRGLQWLAPDGRLAFIMNAYWTGGAAARPLLEHIREVARIDEVFLLGDAKVFPNVQGRHLILSLRRQDDTCSDKVGGTTIKRLMDTSGDVSLDDALSRGDGVETTRKRSDELFTSSGLDLEQGPAVLALDRRHEFAPLGSLGVVRQGIVENPADVTRSAVERIPGDYEVGEGVFVLSRNEIEAMRLHPRERSLLRPYHLPCDLGRYRIAAPSRYLIHSTAETCSDITRFPTIERHLARFRAILDARRETRLGRRPWWQLHWPREARLWTASKILIPQMAARPGVVAVEGPAYVSFSSNVFVPHEETPESMLYIAAVLNSDVLRRWFERRAKRRGVGLDLTVAVLRSAPIRRICFDDADQRARHDELVRLADRMQRIASAPTDHEDSRIDAVVRELYGQADSPRAAVA